MTTQDQTKHHILPLSLYLRIGGTLLVLTIVTVAVAQFDLGPMNLLVAMIIAAVKGTLVVLFFMHLKYANKLYALVLVSALVMVSVFIILTMFDTMSRDQIYDIRLEPVTDRAVIYERGQAPDMASDTAILVDSAAVEVDKLN